jgi:aspartate/methionine/tyrosine aminotransferase
MWNDRLDLLDDFPFRRLARLLEGTPAPAGLPPIDLTIGEPKHAPPALLAQTVAAHAADWNRYPPPVGTPKFRAAAAAWLTRRFALPEGALDPDRHILPLAGTKEGLYMLPQVVVGERTRGERPVVFVPNPVYSTYVGAAVMTGAEPVYLDATAATGFLPDLDALDPALLARCAVFYLCSPANPQGAVADLPYLRRLVRLAREHDFLLIADECYCELYDREPPPSVLEAALADDGTLGSVVAMHSLSKRSSAAGLRSGFCVGDPEVLRRFARLRAYGAAVQPLPLMEAAVALWADEAHVVENRERYRRKFDLAERRLSNRLGFYRPAGGFFLWLDMTGSFKDGEEAASALWRKAGVRCLPGLYLGVTGKDGTNPGRAFLRLAMVHEEAVIDEALARLAEACP